MDLASWIALFRYPLEIASAGLAVAPALIVWQARGYEPDRNLVRFGVTARQKRCAGRGQAWILSLLALIVYGILSEITGTWAWVMDRTASIPSGAEIPLVLKPCIALLMLGATKMLTRVAQREGESQNGLILWGSMILLLTPPLALTLAAR